MGRLQRPPAENGRGMPRVSRSLASNQKEEQERCSEWEGGEGPAHHSRMVSGRSASVSCCLSPHCHCAVLARTIPAATLMRANDGCFERCHFQAAVAISNARLEANIR